jgi:hypothetical protein
MLSKSNQKNKNQEAKMFKLTTILLLLLALLVPAVPAVATGRTYGVTVFVDAKPVSFPDQRPFIDENGRTLVPLRFVAQEMGAEAKWLEADRTVLIEKTQNQPPLIDRVRDIRSFQDLLREAQNLVNRILISLRIGENRARVNDRDVTFDTRPVLVGGRTMVPLRFISETLGADVQWRADTRTVLIRTGRAKQPARAFEGEPTTAGAWRAAATSDELAQMWGNTRIAYTNTAGLPHVVGIQDVLGITVDANHINVTFRGREKAPRMFLAEGNDIRRIRSLTNITARLGDDVWVNSYNLRSTADVHPDMANIGSHADISRITHFIFWGLGLDGNTQLLAVENPHYRGRSR